MFTRQATAAMQGVEGLLPALAAVSAALYLAMVAGFLLARRRRRLPCVPQHGPRVSIIRPLAGIDDELEQNLSSFANLEYRAVVSKRIPRGGGVRWVLAAARDPAVVPAVLLLAHGVVDPARELARSRVRACSLLRHRSGRAQHVAPGSRHGARMSHFKPASSCPDDTEHGHDRAAHGPTSSRE